MSVFGMPNFTRGQRIDQPDMELLADASLEASLAALGPVLDSESIGRVFQGGTLSIPSSGLLQVTKPSAVGGWREKGQVFFGAVISNGPSSRQIGTPSASGTFRVYARFLMEDTDVENRFFWNPNIVGPATAPTEYVRSVSTRRTQDWQLTIALTSPGTEWIYLGTFTNPGAVLGDTRDFFFEGRATPLQTSVSAWSVLTPGVLTFVVPLGHPWEVGLLIASSGFAVFSSGNIPGPQVITGVGTNFITIATTLPVQGPFTDAGLITQMSPFTWGDFPVAGNRRTDFRALYPIKSLREMFSILRTVLREIKGIAWYLPLNSAQSIIGLYNGKLQADGTQDVSGNLKPDVSDARNLGQLSPLRRWAAIYSANYNYGSAKTVLRSIPIIDAGRATNVSYSIGTFTKATSPGTSVIAIPLILPNGASFVGVKIDGNFTANTGVNQAAVRRVIKNAAFTFDLLQSGGVFTVPDSGPALVSVAVNQNLLVDNTSYSYHFEFTSTLDAAFSISSIEVEYTVLNAIQP